MTDEGKLDFHALRTTFTTLVLESGATVKEMQTLCRTQLAVSHAAAWCAKAPPPNMTIWYAQFLVTPFGTQISGTVRREKVRQMRLSASCPQMSEEPHGSHCSFQLSGAWGSVGSGELPLLGVEPIDTLTTRSRLATVFTDDRDSKDNDLH